MLIIVAHVDHALQLVTAGHRKEVLHDMKYSPNGSILAVASNDNFVDFYDVKAGYKLVSEGGGASSR